MISARTRRAWLVTGVISALGAIGGAVVAVALTYIGNRIAGAPQAPGMVVYRWNVTVFAVLGAVSSPVLAWSMLRQVPLWRTVAEPALAGLAASVVSFVVSPALFPVLVPGAILLAALRLDRAYAQPRAHPPGLHRA